MLYNILMARRIEFEVGEWYHCFTRGIDGRETFQDAVDYERFLSLIYLANDETPVTLFNQSQHTLSDALKLERGSRLVTTGAYCLMPNHYHLLLKEHTEKGISRFMQKLGTGYAMYFNLKHQRIGNLFTKPFRAKHIAGEGYFQRLISYLHLNPAELFEGGWKKGGENYIKKMEIQLGIYPYSSLKDYRNADSPTRKLINEEVFDVYQELPLSSLLDEAREYYKELKLD